MNTAPTCRCGDDPIGHVHTREPRRVSGENTPTDPAGDDTEHESQD